MKRTYTPGDIVFTFNGSRLIKTKVLADDGKLIDVYSGDCFPAHKRRCEVSKTRLGLYLKTRCEDITRHADKWLYPDNN